jgi:transaldolase
MTKDPYFIRVHKQTPTMFWINNPTRKQAELALEHGALGCTNNPSFTQKMIDNPEEGEYALKVLDQVIRENQNESDEEIAEEYQRVLAKPISDLFMPLFEKSGGKHGYVSLQGDPINEDDADFVIQGARKNRKLAPNICCKIPTTPSGLKAMETMIEENIPINATEIFAVSQFEAICSTYQRISKKTGHAPMFYMSHIAGIYDDHLRAYVKENNVDISPDTLHQAGLAVARKVYQLMIEREYPCTFIGGGARGLFHFTEMVGGKVVVTINWEGTADKLIEQDPPVVYRISNPVPQKVLDELMEKLPDFKRGYLSDGLAYEEFEHFGPVQLFRSSFMKSWKRVLGLIHDRKAALK